MKHRKIIKQRLDKVDCLSIQALTSLYIDNELPRVVAIQVRNHVQDCNTCRSFIAEVSQVVDIAKTLDEKPLPTDVRSRLWKVLSKEIEENPILNKTASA